MRYNSPYFAQAYGQGSYSTCVYNDNTSCSATAGSTTSGSASGGNQLTNTGFDIALVVTLACFLIFVALAVRIWRKKRDNGGLAEEIISDENDLSNGQDK